MNYEQMSNNKLSITGKILEVPVFSHEVFGEGFYETKIEVKRLSEQVDILPITISERLIIEHDIKVGDVISVSGQFRSYNKMVDDKSRLMLTIFVREILDEESTMNGNNIDIVGFICKQPVYRTTPFKREICDVLLAVNRAYNKSDYLPCIAWGRNARFVRDLSVGEKLEVQGRIQSRKYQKRIDDNNTETRIAYEISLSSVMIMDDTSLTEINNYNIEDHQVIDANELISAGKVAPNTEVV